MQERKANLTAAHVCVMLQLTLDNLKLINHLEEMSKAFGVDLNEDPEGYLTGGEALHLDKLCLMS